MQKEGEPQRTDKNTLFSSCLLQLIAPVGALGHQGCLDPLPGCEKQLHSVFCSPSGHLGLTHLPLSFLGLAVASCPVFMFWSLHLCVHCPPLNSAFKNALRVRVLLPHTPMQALRFLDTSSPTVAEARDCSRFVFVYVSLWHES